MIFRQTGQVERGDKTETRRLPKPNEVEECDDHGNIIAVYTVTNGKRRLKWRVGQHPAIVPKRGAHGVGFITIKAIRREHLQQIDAAGARAEGVANLAAYEKLWGEINGPHSWSTNPEVRVLTFEYAGKVRP